ncbi:MAG TPA: hypothetical protein VLM05_19735, partial [Mycobacteriales bacterium]|nr:hypothetical protein [Mycobacteriales bacterium]
MDNVTRDRARGLWEELAGGRFPAAGGARVVETATSRLCPPGWAGIILLGDALLATAPTAEQAALLRAALPDAGAFPAAGELPATETLGPAELAYLAPAD